ncbi:ATP-binding protein [Desulforhopalus singaporensis]|uniref:histidine kinase n=1 Tax=Desulforhopalus singaporensis TaxID=91360 RepID=A0A1H0VU25_9BACT|nr:transporter substrate-binding domain-containing protein [Desulforhopalus singaporensis]SDP82079.1 Signal transduction histidine kinase [Desulforhopalus singaporensis]
MTTIKKPDGTNPENGDCKYRWACISLLVSLIFLGSVFGYYHKKDPLSVEEREWLTAHNGQIVLIQNCTFPPIEFVDDNGLWNGISKDYITLIEERLGFRFKRMLECEFEKTIETLQKKIAAVKCNFQETPERQSYLSFTAPYLELPNAIIMRKEAKRSLHLAEMKDMKIALVRNFAIHEYIQVNYPHFTLLLVDSSLDGLKKVAFGQADAVIINLAVASYYIESQGLTNLRMVGVAGESNRLSFASTRDMPMLDRILAKGLAEISSKEKKSILKKWIHLEQGGVIYDKRFWYTVGGIYLVVLAVTGSVFTWNRILKSQVDQKTRELKQELAERKMMELQLLQSEKMEAIGTFAGGIAHDFNNALAAIIGYCEMIDTVDAQEGTRLKWRITHALRAAYRAKGLVQQILTFSRQTEQEKRPIYLSPVITEVMDFMKATLPTTIKITKTIKTDNDVINADPTQIHRVLMNLCSNAAQAMQEQGGTLELVLSRTKTLPTSAFLKSKQESGSFICLEVHDSGVGIEPAIINKICQPFFTTNSRSGGTGMGLAVVHSIIKDLDGSLVVDSEPGRGSRFTVYLPECHATVTTPGQLGAAGSVHRAATILFVDDELPLVEFVEDLLNHHGYNVIVSDNSVSALEIFWNDPERVDLVISDITMPHMTGIELAEEILAIRPEIPVVLCSGGNVSGSEQELLSIGVRRLAKKPLGATQLIRIVQEELQASFS